MFDSVDKIPDARKAEPQRFDARLAVAFSCEETTEHGDSPDDLAQRGRCFRDGFLGQDVRAFPLLVSEESRRGKIRMRSAQANQSRQSPRHDHIYGQRQFNLADATELQSFDPTAVFEHVEERLDFPSAAIPCDQLDEVVKGLCGAVGQQSPLDRLDAVGRAGLLGNQASHRQATALAIGQADGTSKELLAHHSRRLPMTRGHHEFNLTQRRAGKNGRPHRKDSLVAVVYLDVDDFKTINDSHGHGVGDALLVAVAQRMKDALRDGDTLSRIGGDEFVAVLVNLEQVKSYQPAVERLLLAAAAPVSVDGLSLQVSVSIDVTIYPNDISDADLLLRHADQALYVAKQSGKNRYHLFDVAHDAAVSTLREGLQHLRAAFDQGEFVLHYQPKVNMRSGEVVGAEALIRWQHPQRGLLTPSAFLPLIESDALAVDLGEWVIAKALTQIERWREQGQDIPVSVNIAASHLQRADFAARLQQMLAAHPSIKPGDLAMEVLESSALDDLSQVSQIIKDCQSLGVSFALDDFGTGYSSLTYLKRLPVSLLKIDQSFVRDMLDDPDDLAILEGVIGLSTAFRRDVIAEGVETVEQGELLLELGCEQAQGYGIGRPMPASDFPRWAAAWRPDARWIGKESARREDLPLLFAQIEHRAWLADMEKYLSNELAEPPSLVLNQSRFGSWLATKTRSCHTGRAVFQTAEHAHGKAHALALELCELKAHGRTREALARRDELRTLGDTVLAYLKALREEWPAHQSAIH